MRLIAVLVTLVAASSLAVRPAAAEPPHETHDGSRYVAACMQSAKTLNVLVLLDRSGSLAGTDPQSVRYDGLRTALETLARLTRADGDPLAVQVAVSAFDQSYVPAKSIANWARINGDDSQDVLDRMMARTKEKTFNKTGATNFHAALEGALQEFEGRTGGDTCNALLWFTDGEFAVGNGVDVASLRADMCRPDGLLDQIRSQGILIVGLQLGTDDSDLKSMSLGETVERTCGTTPRPETQAPGVYLRADEHGVLQRVFQQLGVLLQGCTDAGSSGLIDPGIRRMVVSIPTTNKASTVRFRTPEGENLDVAAEGGSAGAGYVTNGTAYDGMTSIEITFPAGKGAGQWSVSSDQVIDEAGLSYCVFADLSLLEGDNQGVKAAPGAILTAQVIGPDGKPAGVAEYSEVVASAAVVGADGQPRIAHATVDPNGAVTVNFDAEPTDARVDVEIKAQLRTASGLELTPLGLNFAQQLMLSEDYPTITPAHALDLGSAIKRDPTEAEFTLRGSPKGATQVCFDATKDLSVPPEAQGTTLDYEQGCIDLAVDEIRTVTVSATPLAAAVGDGFGRIPVELRPIADSADAGPVEMEVPVSWRFEDPLNPWAVVLTTAIVALLSVALPVLALLFGNWWAARYSTANLGHGVVAVTIKGGNVELERRITPTDLKPLDTEGNSAPRHFAVDGLSFKSKVSFDPSTPPKFWVEPPPGQALVVFPSVADTVLDGSRAQVSPGLGLLTIVHADAARLASDATVPGQLTILAQSGVRPKQLQDAIDALDLSSLRSHLETSRGPGGEVPSTPSDPSASADIWND